MNTRDSGVNSHYRKDRIILLFLFKYKTSLPNTHSPVLADIVCSCTAGEILHVLCVCTVCLVYFHSPIVALYPRLCSAHLSGVQINFKTKDQYQSSIQC